MIRKQETEDLAQIMQIWKEENIRTHYFIKKQYWEENENNVKKLLPNSEIYVYTENQEILGFIGINNQYIEGIFVKEKWQSKGIGKKLMQEVKKNRKKLELSVYEKNKRAIIFYSKIGFKVVDKKLNKDTKEIEYVMMWETKQESE